MYSRQCTKRPLPPPRRVAPLCPIGGRAGVGIGAVSGLPERRRRRAACARRPSCARRSTARPLHVWLWRARPPTIVGAVLTGYCTLLISSARGAGRRTSAPKILGSGRRVAPEKNIVVNALQAPKKILLIGRTSCAAAPAATGPNLRARRGRTMFGAHDLIDGLHSEQPPRREIGCRYG